jgi:hypothetical protein
MPKSVPYSLRKNDSGLHISPSLFSYVSKIPWHLRFRSSSLHFA